MLNTPLQRTLFYIALAFSAAVLSRASLHLPDWTEFVFQAGALLCFIAIFVVARRSKSVERPSAPTSSKAGMRLFALFYIIAVSLSGPWWLPYTGVHLAFPQLVVTSLITCAIGVAIWLTAWHRARRKA
jgi:hypothetical protein